MGLKALLPCLVCARELDNVFANADNQPHGGTVFRTEGHYGSTFWDSFDGEELVITVCDDCLRARADRLGQQKVHLPVECEGLTGFGRQHVDRPLVAYTGHPDGSRAHLLPEELGTDIPGVEWSPHIEELREGLA